MSGHTLEFFPNYNAGRPETPGEWARAREAEGWHGLAASDHFVTMHLSYPHLWVALTEMALSTGTIPITSSFANNLFRSPVEFAQAALTLQRVSNGRFEAGLGAGWIEDEIVRIGWRFPDGPERAGRYIEAMQIVRELLQTGRCRFAGRHYQIDIDEPGFSSLAPNPPRLVGSAGGPRTLREIPRFVDRLEIQPNASATRGGSVDLVRSAAIEEADVVDAVARVRRVREPNILVIWGDDIGQFNVSAYNQGMMGYKTPNIDRIAKRGRPLHRLVRPAELHRRSRRLHHRPVADPHRPHQGRPARRAGGHEEGRPDDRDAAQGAGLHDRPVRQEPPRRPRRDAADEPRLRRVLRQPLPPQRRGGAGEPDYTRRIRSSRRSSARAA
jgi:hypothetical protein